MKAKCPFCQSGCDKCKEGFVEVELSKGLVYDLKCNKCGSIVGFHIDDGDNPPEKDMSDMCCVICDDPQDLQWVLSSYNTPPRL